MSRASIRAAVLAYFTGTPGISTLAQDEPWFTPGQAWINNGIPGTSCYVHINGQSESIESLGGANLQKVVTYDVALVIQYQYAIPANPSPTRDDYATGLDALIDTIVRKIRADPTLGCAANGPVWQAGIHDGDNVAVSDLPQRDPSGGKVWSISFVKFKTMEIVQGTG
jgi:hypothetical protein